MENPTTIASILLPSLLFGVALFYFRFASTRTPTQPKVPFTPSTAEDMNIYQPGSTFGLTRASDLTEEISSASSRDDPALQIYDIHAKLVYIEGGYFSPFFLSLSLVSLTLPNPLPYPSPLLLFSILNLEITSLFNFISRGQTFVDIGSLHFAYQTIVPGVPEEWARRVLPYLFPSGTMTISDLEKGIASLMHSPILVQAKFLFLLMDRDCTGTMSHKKLSDGLNSTGLGQTLSAAIFPKELSLQELLELVNDGNGDLKRIFTFTPSRLFQFFIKSSPPASFSERTSRTCLCPLSSPVSSFRQLLHVYTVFYFLTVAGIIIWSLSLTSTAALPLRVAKLAGAVINIHSALLLFTGLRTFPFLCSLLSPFFSSLLVLDYSKDIHRALGMWSSFWVAIHIISHTFNYTMYRIDPLPVWFVGIETTAPGIFVPELSAAGWAFFTGVALTTVLLLILGGTVLRVAFSTTFSFSFEIFTSTHTLTIVYGIVGLFHAHNIGLWTAHLVVLLLLEWLSRLYFRQRVYFATKRYLPLDVIELTVDTPGQLFCPSAGSYALLNIPMLSTLEFHPFTVTAQEGEKVVFLIRPKAKHSWTYKLSQLSLSSSIPVHLDGPFFAPSSETLTCTSTLLHKKSFISFPLTAQKLPSPLFFNTDIKAPTLL